MVANLDQVLVVFACADPQPHVRMIDRFLVVAEMNEIEPIVVANKVDLVGIDAHHADGIVEPGRQGPELALHLGSQPRARLREVAAQRASLHRERRGRDRHRGDDAADRDARRRARDKGWKDHPHRHCRM